MDVLSPTRGLGIGGTGLPARGEHGGQLDVKFSKLPSPILWHPEFGAGWKLKRLRQDPDDGVLPFVDIQSCTDQGRVAPEPPLSKSSRHYHYTRPCGLIFFLEKLPTEQRQDFRFREECARHCCAVHSLHGIYYADFEEFDGSCSHREEELKVL